MIAMTLMSMRSRYSAALCLALLPPAFLPVACQPPPSTSKPVLEASDHREIGGLISDCIVAYVSKEGRELAESKLHKTIQEKWKKAADGRDPLSLSDDLAASLWYAVGYTRVKGIHKGEVDEVELRVPFYGKDFMTTCAVWTPKGYDPKGPALPAILCIPAAGEKAEEHLDKYWSHSSIRDNAVLIAIQMPENTAHWGGLGEKDDSEQVGGVGLVFTTFKDITSRYAIDFSRVFLAGRGIGVDAAMRIANSSPDRFAGIIGRKGDAAELVPDNLSNVPCFFAGAGERASEFVEAAKASGFVENVLHADATEVDVWAWIETVARRSNPEQVTLRPGTPFPNRAYWIEVTPKKYLPDTRVKAKADRASNTITIDAVGIKEITLYFNDTIVDLDKPIKVICNGAVHESTVPRNFSSMMEQIYRSRSDSGKLYTAVKSYDLP